MVTLPIAFSSTGYCVVASTCGDKKIENYPVAYSLTTSNFMVSNNTYETWWFATGKQQWGENATAKPATATFPISCNIVVSAMSNYIGTKGSEYATLIYGTSTTTLTVMCDYNGTLNTSKYYWFAICIQQWGSLYIPKDQKLQFVYPITFISTAFAIALSNEGTSNTAYASAFSDLTNSSVYLADNAATVHCIIVGVQQWGDLSMTVAKKTFPISFTYTYQVIGGIVNSTYVGTYAPVYISVNSITNTGFTNPDTSGYIGGKRTWIAFGIQQWGINKQSGYVPTNDELFTTITYPLKFGSTVYVIKTQPTSNITWAWVTEITTTKATVAHTAYYTVQQLEKEHWIALGIQQWGQCYGYKNSKETTLPIGFTSAKLCEFVSLTYSSSFYEVPACIKRDDGSLTTITTGVYSGSSSTATPLRFLILGI